MGMFGASTETRASRQPEACPLRLLRRDFQAVLTPDPLAPLMSGNPAFLLQKRGAATLAIASVLPAQGNNTRAKGCFISGPSWHILLRRPALSHHSARPAFRHREPRLHITHGLTASCRA